MPSLKYLLVFLWLLLADSKTTLGQDVSNKSLDHISIVVADLEAATRHFKALGFTIKPGTKHENSIENAHIKFQDGSALELITATEPRDELAKTYLDLKKAGDGPAFVCFGMDDTENISDLLSDFQMEKTTGSYYEWLTFPAENELSYIFFMKYLKSPVDKTEHLTHENGALGIRSITLTKQDFSSEESVFGALGYLPLTKTNSSSRYQAGNLQITLLNSRPANSRALSGIIVYVKDINATLETLPKGFPFIYTTANTIILPADHCHGIEITLVQA